jgi:hypothetical protein
MYPGAGCTCLTENIINNLICIEANKLRYTDKTTVLNREFNITSTSAQAVCSDEVVEAGSYYVLAYPTAVAGGISSVYKNQGGTEAKVNYFTNNISLDGGTTVIGQYEIGGVMYIIYCARAQAGVQNGITHTFNMHLKS